jgi:alkylhydroperoxidase/carboxymuconolactone decarboxylase family protein YurZ
VRFIQKAKALGLFFPHLQEFHEEILKCGHLGMKRFFALDHQVYEPGALDTKTKELLGLVASAVLRCEDSARSPRF